MVTPAEARSAAYNALTAAGHSHDDAMYVIRQMKAAATSPAAEDAGERGASLPLPSPATRTAKTAQYGATEPAKRGRPRRERWPEVPKRFRNPSQLDDIDRWALDLIAGEATAEEAAAPIGVR